MVTSFEFLCSSCNRNRRFVQKWEIDLFFLFFFYPLDNFSAFCITFAQGCHRMSRALQFINLLPLRDTNCRPGCFKLKATQVNQNTVKISVIIFADDSSINQLYLYLAWDQQRDLIVLSLQSFPPEFSIGAGKIVFSLGARLESPTVIND